MTSHHAAPVADPYQVWLNRASRLAAVLKEVRSIDVRIAVLKRLSDRMDDPGYPGLLKLLITISESNDQTARQSLADTLAVALQRLDPPAGELTAWGGGSSWNDLAIQPGHWFDIQTLANTPVRRFGPIEYLVVWYSQKTQRPYLSEEAYLNSVQQLIELINLSDLGRQLYPAKILSDLEHGQEGNYSRRSRSSLTQLARCWQAGESPKHIAIASL